MKIVGSINGYCCVNRVNRVNRVYKTNTTNVIHNLAINERF